MAYACVDCGLWPAGDTNARAQVIFPKLTVPDVHRFAFSFLPSFLRSFRLLFFPLLHPSFLPHSAARRRWTATARRLLQPNERISYLPTPFFVRFSVPIPPPPPTRLCTSYCLQKLSIPRSKLPIAAAMVTTNDPDNSIVADPFSGVARRRSLEPRHDWQRCQQQQQQQRSIRKNYCCRRTYFLVL
jgi:hypothetical protein